MSAFPSSPDAQWAYKANRSTRGRLDWGKLRPVKPVRTRAGASIDLRVRIRELEAENRQLRAMIEPRRRKAATPAGQLGLVGHGNGG